MTDIMKLSDQVCAQIDQWVAKFPEGQQRSALLMGLACGSR